jgi:DNA-binding CsgD family transcriptional regulator
MDLDAEDLARAFTVVQAVHQARDLDEFPAVVMNQVRAVVECDLAGYNEVDPRIPRLVVQVSPRDDPRVGPWVEPTWERYMHQHPLVNHYLATGDGSAHTISEFLSQDEFHALDLYREVYGPARCEYQISITLPAPHPLIVAIVLNRPDRDFDDRDRAMLDLLRPHLTHAYRSAQLRSTFDALARSMDSGGVGMVLIEPPDRVVASSPTVGDLLGRTVREGRIVDPDLLAWLDRERRAFGDRNAAGDGGPVIHGTRQLETARGSVLLRFVSRAGGGLEALVCESRGAIDEDRLAALGLTPRQRAVLWQLVRGESTASIAASLGVTLATVRKHLENIYAALGVHERGAAVAQAIDVLLWP